MGAPAKLLHVLGMLAKIEPGYGTAATLAATADGVQLQYSDRNQAALATISYANDGDMGPSVSALGRVIRAAPSGRSIQGDFPMRFRGPGSAYSTSVVPNLHTILQACGFDATLTTTTGSEKWAYTLTPAGSSYKSATLGLYGRGELETVVGAIGNIKFDAPDASPPLWTASLQGMLPSLPTDVATPAITYPNQAVQPPLATSVALTFGTFTTNAVIKSSSWDLGRTMSPRVRQSGSGGHLGFVPEDFAPMITIAIEATALIGSPFTSAAGFDAYSLRDGAPSLAAALQYGTVQYNRFKLNFPQCQVIDARPTSDGAVAMMEIDLQAFNSTASSNDSMTLVAD